jgi:hypothetical protein
MKKDYSQKTLVESNSVNAFDAINLGLSKWWGSVDKQAKAVGDQFTITFGDAYWTFEITEYKINEKVVWDCIDGQPELNNEWIGHILTWTINEIDNTFVEISLHQLGLTDALPCFNICSTAWDRFILSSLKQYLETGNGAPGS